MRGWVGFGSLLLVFPAYFLTGMLPQQPSAPAQAGSGVAASVSKFRVVRSVSGTQGVQQNGAYFIQDPRTVFYVPQDKHVIVYFEWEGPLGPHHFEGVWKNPDGKVTAISDFDYEAKQARFGGYWELLLAETTETGVWLLEARVDGEVTGTHTFQILAAPRPASAIPAKTILSPSEIYQKVQAATVSIEKRNAAGELMSQGSGTSIGSGLVLTAFQVIDGAASLRILLPDGQTIHSKDVAAWNRRQDWAILRVNLEKTPQLVSAKLDSWAVGDRCYYLDTAAAGSRIIVDTDIVGKNDLAGWGDRLYLAHGPSQQGAGAALVNEYGEIIGVLGGSIFPGIASAGGSRFGYARNLALAGSAYRGAMVTPISMVRFPPPDAHNTSLDELAGNGQFLPPLEGADEIIFGTMSRALQKSQGLPRAVDEKFEYSLRDPQAVVLLDWVPQKKRKGLTTVRIYDLDNRLVAESKPVKVNLSPNQAAYWNATLSLTGLSPAIYRLDVTFDGKPVWRTFFQVVE
jgi:trypsin-like peptidase